MESLSTVLMMIIIPTTVLRIFECESQWTESSWGGHPPHSFLFDITKKNMPRWDNSLADRQGVLEATIYSHSRLLKNCKLAQHFVLISLLRHKSSSNQIVRKIRSENLKNPFTLRAVEGERAWKRWIRNRGRALRVLLVGQVPGRSHQWPSATCVTFIESAKKWLGVLACVRSLVKVSVEAYIIIFHIILLLLTPNLVEPETRAYHQRKWLPQLQLLEDILGMMGKGTHTHTYKKKVYSLLCRVPPASSCSCVKQVSGCQCQVNVNLWSFINILYKI